MDCLVLCSTSHGMSLAELGERMGGMDYAAVSDGVQRFERTLDNQRDAKKELAEATEMLRRVTSARKAQ